MSLGLRNYQSRVHTIWVRTATNRASPILVRDWALPLALTSWIAPSVWDPQASVPNCLAVMFSNKPSIKIAARVESATAISGSFKAAKVDASALV